MERVLDGFDLGDALIKINNIIAIDFIIEMQHSKITFRPAIPPESSKIGLDGNHAMAKNREQDQLLEIQDNFERSLTDILEKSAFEQSAAAGKYLYCSPESETRHYLTQ